MRFLNKFLGLVIILAVIIVSGCTSTVIPKTVKASQPSWDGNQQNSGWLGWAPQGGGYLTPHARDRYNGLIDTYGSKYNPALTRDAGIAHATNNFYIDGEHLKKFGEMNSWKKNLVK